MTTLAVLAGCSTTTPGDGAGGGGAGAGAAGAAGTGAAGAGGGTGGAGGGPAGSGGAGGNGGASGGAAGAGGAMANPVTILASGEKNPGGIATDGKNVYWTTYNASIGFPNGPGAIRKVPVGGGTPVSLAKNVDNCGLLAVDSTDVYWFGPDDNFVAKVPVGGGKVDMFAKNLGNSPWGIAVDDKNVYWNDGQNLMQVPLAGGTATTLASNLNLVAQYGVPNIAVSFGEVILTTDTSIIMVPVGGGVPVTMASGQSPVAVVSLGITVYWLNAGGGQPSAVMAVDFDLDPPRPLASVAPPAVPAFLAVDESYVYWVELLGSVKKVPLGGGTPIILASAPAVTGGIAVDDTSVYWTDVPGGKVLKVAK